MKRALINLGLWGLLVLTAWAQPANPIQQVPLNPLAVIRIPVSLTGPTTIRFPSPVSDLEGAFISSDPGSSALFLLSFRPGNSFFSVRALVGNTNTTLNVVWKEQTYVLELVESRRPWLSVIFTQPAATVSSGQVPHSPVTPLRLLGFLDTAKAYPLLKTQHPEAVAGVACVRTNTLNDYGDYTITTEEIIRFDEADTLVFRIVVSNKTERIMRYLPQSLMVQAGQRVFYQSITDAKGEVPPQSSLPIYFAITGTSDGGRNDASPHNDFLVLLHRLDVPNVAAVPATPSQNTNVAVPGAVGSAENVKTQTAKTPIEPATIIIRAANPPPQPSPVIIPNCGQSRQSTVPIYYAATPPTQAPCATTYYYVSPPTVYYAAPPIYYHETVSRFPRWFERIFGHDH